MLKQNAVISLQLFTDSSFAYVQSTNVVYCLQGIFISKVSAEGAAEKAGIVFGDKLISVSHWLCLLQCRFYD